MDCQSVRAAMYTATDNELDAEVLIVFREHLGRCPNCAGEYEYLAKLLALVRERCCRYTAPSSLKVRILSSFPHRGGVALENAE